MKYPTYNFTLAPKDDDFGLMPIKESEDDYCGHPLIAIPKEAKSGDTVQIKLIDVKSDEDLVLEGEIKNEYVSFEIPDFDLGAIHFDVRDTHEKYVGDKKFEHKGFKLLMCIDLPKMDTETLVRTPIKKPEKPENKETTSDILKKVLRVILQRTKNQPDYMVKPILVNIINEEVTKLEEADGELMCGLK
jgi:hypothetical protein